jgi:hypothetical protein
MHNPRKLDIIEVKQPCPALWDEMIGDEKRRFCDHCRKFVHNLSAMPEDEAERLVCSAAGSLCVRFARDAQTGKTITLNYAPRPITARRRGLVTIASILAACSITATWATSKVLRKPAPPAPPPMVTGIMAMGDIVAPPAANPSEK